MEGDLVVAIYGHRIQVPVPRPARVETQLLVRTSEQHVPRAFNILRRERLAIVPFDTVAYPKRQLRPALVPRPFAGQIRHDGLNVVLWHMLVVHDEVVE